jgi:YtkA-like
MTIMNKVTPVEEFDINQNWRGENCISFPSRIEVSIMGSTMVFLLALLLPLTGFATETNQPSSDLYAKHNEKSFLKKTQKGSFSVKLVIKDEELKVGVNAFDIIVHDKKGKDVVGAVLNVTPWMPEMGHGSFETRYQGNGKRPLQC